MKEFNIAETNDLLSIKRSTFSANKPLFLELFIMVIGFFIVLSFPYEQVIALSKLLVVIYFLPLLRIGKLVKVANRAIQSDVYTFDKRRGTFSINNQLQCAFKEIKELQLRNNNEEINTLYIFLTRGSWLELSSNGSINEYKKTGRLIAKTTGVKFWDKRKFCNELLWDDISLSDTDITAINSQHSKYK